MIRLLASAIARPAGLLAARVREYDLVNRGGRVMGPETGRDAIRDRGLTGGTMFPISKKAISGREAIGGAGFTDLRQPSWEDDPDRPKIRDGVNGGLERDSGTDDVAKWDASHVGRRSSPLRPRVFDGRGAEGLKLVIRRPQHAPTRDAAGGRGENPEPRLLERSSGRAKSGYSRLAPFIASRRRGSSV